MSLDTSDLHWEIQAREWENLVEAVDDCLENIELGKFVAVHLANYDKVPVIGKVLQVNGDNIKIHYWKVSFKGISGVHKMCPEG